MKSHLLFAGWAFSLLFLNQSVVAQSEAIAAVEGHVFNSENHRPLQNVNVVLVSYPGGDAFGYASSISDKGGFFQVALPTDPPLQSIAIDLYVECTPKNSGKLIRYKTSFYRDLVAGRVYTRDMYIRLPKGDTECTRKPLAPIPPLS